MEVIHIEQGTEDWKALRLGKITGTKLGKLYKQNKSGDLTGHKIGFYEIIAERMATPDEDGLGSNIERGTRLESEAIDEAEKKLGMTFTRGNVWKLDDGQITSPDGYTEDMTEAIEVKCLASSRHIMAIATSTPPEEYMAEYMSYFIVNPKLERLHVCLYDPRFPTESTRLAIMTLTRVEFEDDIANWRAVAQMAKAEINETIERLLSWTN